MIFWEHSTCSSFFAFGPYLLFKNWWIHCIAFYSLSPNIQFCFIQSQYFNNMCNCIFVCLCSKAKHPFFVYFSESTIVFSQWFRLHYFLHAIVGSNNSLIFKVRNFNRPSNLEAIILPLQLRLKQEEKVQDEGLGKCSLIFCRTKSF